MKMRTLALAVGMVAGLPMAANAAPDFYGKFNLSLDRASDYPTLDLDDSIAAVQATTSPLADAWFVESHKSRIGMRGSEALYSPNLKVIYQLEVGVDVDGDDVDSGGDADPFSVRNSFLGLDTTFGQVFAGRYDSVIKQAEGGIDQFNNTAADMENVFLGQQRLSNTLNWRSNSFNGMTIRAQVAPGEGMSGEDGLADTFGISGTFEQNGVYVAVALENSFLDDGGVAADTETLRGALGADLGGGLQVGAIIEQVEVEYAAGDVDGTSFLVSGRLEVNDRLAVKAQMAKFDSSDLDTEITTITGGADYKLGKQTKVYALVSLSDTEAENAAGTFEVDESGNLVSFGMEHNF